MAAPAPPTGGPPGGPRATTWRAIGPHPVAAVGRVASATATPTRTGSLVVPSVAVRSGHATIGRWARAASYRVAPASAGVAAASAPVVRDPAAHALPALAQAAPGLVDSDPVQHGRARPAQAAARVTTTAALPGVTVKRAIGVRHHAVIVTTTGVVRRHGVTVTKETVVR